MARELERRLGRGVERAAPRRGRLRSIRPRPAAGLSECEREHLRASARPAGDVARAATTAADRQRIIRLLIDEVVVTIRGESEWVDVTIHWAGGFRTAHELVRPVQRYQQMADYERLLNRIDELGQAGQSLADVAEQLNREGFHPPKRAAQFTSATLTRLLAKRGRTRPRPQAVAEPGVLGEHEWLLSDLARNLEMPQATLHRWIRVGWVHARKLSTRGGHWVIWADAEELDRMTRLRTCPRGWSDEPMISQLIKPKTRENN